MRTIVESSCRESDERFVSAVQTANRRCVHKRGSVWSLSPVGLVDLSDPTTALQLRTGATGGSYSVSISSAVIGVRSAVGFVASRESPNVWRVRSASTDLQAAFGPKSPRPRWPYLVAGRLSVEMGPTWPQSPYNVVRQLADSSALRSSPNVWDDRSGLSDVFARRAFRPTDWHNCFGPRVLTGDLVLADNRRFPLFLHARAVALSMPEPSLGAPVPSRSLLFGVELFDRFARP